MDSAYVTLSRIQRELSVPKSKFNKFGGYSYRSLEDINAAAKPVCETYRAGYAFSDQPVVIGDRYYIKAECTFWVEDSSTIIKSVAYAREQGEKKGMDEAQITGLASSYARKYAVCALFAIDSGEEVDAMDNHAGKQTAKPKSEPKPVPKRNVQATPEQLEELTRLVTEFSKMKEKTPAEVIEAVNASKTMQAEGVEKGQTSYNANQCGKAIELLKSWIERS